VFEDSEQAAQYAKMFTELANMMKEWEEREDDNGEGSQQED